MNDLQPRPATIQVDRRPSFTGGAAPTEPNFDEENALFIKNKVMKPILMEKVVAIRNVC